MLLMGKLYEVNKTVKCIWLTRVQVRGASTEITLGGNNTTLLQHLLALSRGGRVGGTEERSV